MRPQVSPPAAMATKPSCAMRFSSFSMDGKELLRMARKMLWCSMGFWDSASTFLSAAEERSSMMN